MTTKLSYDHENIARELAQEVFVRHCHDVPYLTITEALDGKTGGELTPEACNDIALHVDDLIARAKFAIELPASENELIQAKEMGDES